MTKKNEFGEIPGFDELFAKVHEAWCTYQSARSSLGGKSGNDLFGLDVGCYDGRYVGQDAALVQDLVEIYAQNIANAKKALQAAVNELKYFDLA